MARSYRINVRFDPEDPAEAALLDHLKTLQKEKQCSFSQLIISILKEHLSAGTSGVPFSLDDIRLVLREELEEISITPAVSSNLLSAEEVHLSEEEQEENDRSVLEDLEMFG